MRGVSIRKPPAHKGTVGTPDANGKPAASAGHVIFKHKYWRASLRTIVIALTVALGAPPGPPPGPAEAHELGTADPAGLAYHNCHEVAPFVEVDYAAADALVPPGYTVFRTPAGTAGLFLNGISCESITVGGITVRNVIESHMSILIVPPYPNDPDNPADANEPCTRTPCPAEPPHPSFIAAGRHMESPGDSQLRLESYIVQWITNSPEYARWMRRGTGLGDKIRVVPGLVFEYEPRPAHVFPAVDDSYFFKAPSPAPSPFHVGCAKDEERTGCSAVVTEPSPVVFEEGINWWGDTQQGTSIIHSDFHLGPNQRFGTAEGTVTSDDPGSPMGTMFAAADDANILSQVHGQPRSRQTKRFSTEDQELVAVSGEFTDIQLTKCVRNDSNPCSAENHPPPEAKGASCNAADRSAYLGDEQAVVLDLVSHYGPGDGRDLTTLDERQDIVALAEGDPESGTRYGVYDHAFVSFRGMGLAIINAGDNGTEPDGRRRPGKPDLLLYAPKDPNADATDPYGPDLPYELAGWAYSPLSYDYYQHPTFLGECIERKDWFVHERGIHPADSWGMVSVPPDEEGQVHGQASGQDPILPSECDDPRTLVVETCPAGIQHTRIWDIHFWRGKGRASVSMLSPNPIAGIDPEVGKGFFYPDDSALAGGL
jgi:hypothetical protein